MFKKNVRSCLAMVLVLCLLISVPITASAKTNAEIAVEDAVYYCSRAQQLVDLIVDIAIEGEYADMFEGSNTSSTIKSIALDLVVDELDNQEDLMVEFGFEPTDENKQLVAEEVYYVACIYYDELHRDGGSAASANKLSIIEIIRFVLVESWDYSNEDAVETAEFYHEVNRVYLEQGEDAALEYAESVVGMGPPEAPDEPTVPATPKILSCFSKQQTSVKVTWELVENAEGYEIWSTATPDNEASWTRVKTVSGNTTDRYTKQGLEKGVTYYYKVRAFVLDDNGERICSDFSNVDYMPAAVVWDGPYSNATFRVRLRWNEIGGAHGYQLWRKNADGSWGIIKTLGDKGNTLTNNQGATTAYSNTGLVSGENYTYKMRAFMINEDGRKVFGAYSDEFTVAAMPETPVVTGDNSKAGRAQLSWQEINGAAGYQVWMLDGDNWGIVKSITDGSTNYTKYDLQSGTAYQFKVRAYTDVDGKKTFGAYSEIVTVTVK
ncbi:MAG: fibronectin type III domain-containing protein [Oscillospiraceae bacterium]|nr:fibronectin type III domain-containing protein [Oscillospiraceae bacterium]